MRKGWLVLLIVCFLTSLGLAAEKYAKIEVAPGYTFAGTNDEQNKVLIGFKLGDLYAESFTYKRGKRAGQIGISLKARLLQVHWAKVNGEKHPLPDETTENNNHQPAAAAA